MQADKKNMSCEQDATKRIKKPYATPQLVIHGDVEKITKFFSMKEGSPVAQYPSTARIIF